jgi:Ca-activated chloride channel homolog
VAPGAATRPFSPEAAPHDLRHGKPIRVDVELVLVPVTITDSSNRLVLGLQKQDFTLYEGDKPQQIQYFSVEDAPISVGLILDLSESMANKFVAERAAVEAFFNNANAQDDYFVVTFSDRPRVVATSTRSLDDIQQKLATAIPEGQTALLDAVYLALARMQSAQYRRRALLLITDGADNHSRYGMKEIKSVAQEADVEVFAIGIFDSLMPFRSFEEFMGKRWLSEITDITGGHTVAISDFEKMPEAAAKLSREMRTQYLLGYRPKKMARDGKWRKIRVEVARTASGEKMQAYYKKGYPAPSE